MRLRFAPCSSSCVNVNPGASTWILKLWMRRMGNNLYCLNARRSQTAGTDTRIKCSSPFFDKKGTLEKQPYRRQATSY